MGQMDSPGKRNFLGLAPAFSSIEGSLFNILPVPYDATSTYMPGSRRGPQAIIDASRNLETYDHELDAEPASAGVATLDEVPVVVGDPAVMIAAVEAAVGEIADRGRIPVVLGGEHTVSLGAVRALARRERFCVVSLDAHADLRDSYQGSPLSHACFLRRASEVAECCAFGVRSISAEEADHLKTSRTKVFYAEAMLRQGINTLSLDFIPQTVYLSIDVDVLDPSIMPATGTPEPGGLGWYETVGLLTRMVRGRRVIGFDVVELCPAAGSPAPDFTAAKLAYKLMGAIVKFGLTREDHGIRHG
jgi:agmatinase